MNFLRLLYIKYRFMQTQAKNIKYFYKQKHAKWANAASWQNAADLLCKRIIPNINKWQIFLLVNSKGACLSFDISANSRLKNWHTYGRILMDEWLRNLLVKIGAANINHTLQRESEQTFAHIQIWFSLYYTKGMIRLLKWNWYFAFR